MRVLEKISPFFTRFSFLFYLVIFIWIANFFLEYLLTKGSREVKIIDDRNSALLIRVNYNTSIGIAFVLAYAGIAVLPAWMFYPGIVIMLLGMVVREWAIVTLRSYFSDHVRVLKDHKVIDKGPYRLIRHPAYSGSMLTIAGLGIALGSWAGVLVIIVLSSIAYAYRISVEEKVLLIELGEEYAQYMRRTKMVIPFII
jgi:protein-S-isoprenylcysteine O-methyltransferase Ste14